MKPGLLPAILLLHPLAALHAAAEPLRTATFQVDATPPVASPPRRRLSKC